MGTSISTKKTAKKAINEIEYLLDSLDFLDYHFNVDDTKISWDGHIDLYHGNIDDKSNFDGRIDVQIKGRTTTNKRLENKWKFDLDKRDLENYHKVDGTLFLAVRFKKNGEFKIYYNSLLPKNINDLLKQPTNPKNEIKVSFKEIEGANHLERICRNFLLDKNIQKKLSENVFQNNKLTINDSRLGSVSDWGRGEFNPLAILGEEKFIYFSDESKNIIDVKYAEINEVVHNIELDIKTKDGKIYYKIANHRIALENKQKISFGKAFELSNNPKKFNITLKGTLNERIKQLEFIDNILEKEGFYLGKMSVEIYGDTQIKGKYKNILINYRKIKTFCEEHYIMKDINLDLWENKDFNKFLIWIAAIENGIKINIKEFDISTIGFAKIKDIKFSIFAEKLSDGSFQVYSIWNTENRNRYEFRYGNNEDAIKTNNFFSILNKEAYQSDDININEMKKIYDSYTLEKEEEILINLQVLEIIKAYDVTLDINLLEYAKYLLSKIENMDTIKNVARINFLQIEKRIRDLTDSEIQEVIEIRDETDDKFFKISTNLLIGNKKEAKIILDSLTKGEKNAYLLFPISIFFESI